MPYQDKNPHRTGIGARFPLGKTTYSDGIRELIASDPVAEMSLNTCLRFHQDGQWGNSDPEDVRANEQSLVDGGAVISCYQLQGRTIVIITDAEPRETTTVLLREEYSPGRRLPRLSGRLPRDRA